MKEIGEKRILVAGDVMLDEYRFGTVKRISPEAPVPVLLENQEKTRAVPGGAANVALNLAAAGQRVSLLSAAGEDECGAKLLALLGQAGIDTAYVTKDKSRMTTRKIRYLGQNNQQLLRVDHETAREVDVEVLGEILESLGSHIGLYDMIVLSDYGKGFLSEEMIGALRETAAAAGIPVLSDVKGRHREKYRDLFLVKPNQRELEILMEAQCKSLEETAHQAALLCRECGIQYALVTCGADGMLLTERKGLVKHMPSVRKDVFDVTGAGDTVLAYVAAALANGMDLIRAMETASVAAGIQVSRVGACAVSLKEVGEELYRKSDAVRYKILDRDSLKSLRRSEPGKIVFTNGCFDILHIGHIACLQAAASLGDKLVVGVNSDDSVRRLKGPERPVNGQDERCRMLAALAFVDYVTVFEEDTPCELIRSLKPDVLVKGGDYGLEEIAGRDIVEEAGGEVVTVPLVEGVSTTNLINRAGERGKHHG